MRTTIDIPDSVFREIKARAALQGRSLKDWILGAVQAELRESGKTAKGVRISLPLVKSKEKTYRVSPDQLAEILEEEDRELSA